MYEPRKAFEQKCNLCKTRWIGYKCGKDKNKCYSKYLEELTKLMLEALIETYLSIDSPIRVMDKNAVRKLIEKVTQKKIEELKEYDDVCIDDLIGGNG